MKRLSILAAMAIAMAVVVTTSVLSATAVFAQTATPTPTTTPTPYPAGTYALKITCGNYSAAVTSYTFTINGMPVSSPTPLSGLQCSPNYSAGQNIQPPASWNDLTLQYWCVIGTPAGTPTPNTIYIPPYILRGWQYPLTCPSTGIVHTPEPTHTPVPTHTPAPPGTPTETPEVYAKAEIGAALTPTPSTASIGGIADLPDAATGAAEAGAAGNDSSHAPYLAIAGMAVVLAVGAGGWYARRRYSVRRR